jgi:hypothetical protein
MTRAEANAHWARHFWAKAQRLEAENERLTAALAARADLAAEVERLRTALALIESKAANTPQHWQMGIRLLFSEIQTVASGALQDTATSESQP